MSIKGAINSIASNIFFGDNNLPLAFDTFVGKVNTIYAEGDIPFEGYNIPNSTDALFGTSNANNIPTVLIKENIVNLPKCFFTIILPYFPDSCTISLSFTENVTVGCTWSMGVLDITKIAKKTPYIKHNDNVAIFPIIALDAYIK